MTQEDQQQKSVSAQDDSESSSPKQTAPQASSRTQLLVTTALLTALVFVVTRFGGFEVPMPPFGSQWLNLGDTSIAASALLLGHPLAAFAGGVGSALSNLTSAPTIMIYAPATLLIKGSMGYVLYVFARKGKFSWFAVGVFLAELIMVVGYATYLFFLLYFGIVGGESGTTALAGTFATIPANLIQAGVNFVLALLLFVPIMAIRKALWGGGTAANPATGA